MCRATVTEPSSWWSRAPEPAGPGLAVWRVGSLEPRAQAGLRAPFAAPAPDSRVLSAAGSSQLLPASSKRCLTYESPWLVPPLGTTWVVLGTRPSGWGHAEGPRPGLEPGHHRLLRLGVLVPAAGRPFPGGSWWTADEPVCPGGGAAGEDVRRAPRARGPGGALSSDAPLVAVPLLLRRPRPARLAPGASRGCFPHPSSSHGAGSSRPRVYVTHRGALLHPTL